MTPIRTVLCPVDFTTVTEPTLAIAVEMCRRSGARLVLHHNLGPAPPDFLGVHWMWDEEHEAGGDREETTVADEFGKIFANLPDDLDYEAKVSRGPLEDGVLYLARELPADLVVLGSHGASSAEHRSLTDQIVLRAPCPVLATAEGFDSAALATRAEDAGERRPILVATDLSGHDLGAVSLAFELAATLPYDVHLLHVLKPTRKMTEGKRLAAERQAQRRLTELVPEDSRETTHLHLRWGAPAAEILAAATDLDVQLLLLGARRHGFLHRAISGLTSLEVLHESRWPVWFVPADRTPRGLGSGSREQSPGRERCGSAPAAAKGEPMEWKEAKERTIAQWEGIRAGLGRELPVDLVAEVNAVAELCVKARDAAGDPATRCNFCVAFGDVGGCSRVNLQITEALLEEDWDRARVYIDEVLQLLRSATLPAEPAQQAS